VTPSHPPDGRCRSGAPTSPEGERVRARVTPVGAGFRLNLRRLHASRAEPFELLLEIGGQLEKKAFCDRNVAGRVSDQPLDAEARARETITRTGRRPEFELADIYAELRDVIFPTSTRQESSWPEDASSTPRNILPRVKVEQMAERASGLVRVCLRGGISVFPPTTAAGPAPPMPSAAWCFVLWLIVKNSRLVWGIPHPLVSVRGRQAPPVPFHDDGLRLLLTKEVFPIAA
jgi:hypothetical protein